MDDKQVPGYEHGNFIGPTILTDVTADMECYKACLFSFNDILLCTLKIVYLDFKLA